MTPEEIVQKIRNQLSQGNSISANTLSQVKKQFEEIKNTQSQGVGRPQDFFSFKEKIIQYFINALSEGNPPFKDKITILQILERDLISSKHNISLFNKLYQFLLQQDQNVAIQASKTIDALIKQINEGKQATSGAILLDMKQHYIKLFQFLKEKTEFLLKLSQHTKDPDFKVYRRLPYEQKDKQKEVKDKDKKDIVFKNSKSLKFINQVPHLFIHLMAYVDTTNRNQEDQAKIRELIKKSIDNIIQALRKTPYEEFYNEFNYDFNNQLFCVMTKLLQFLFINLKSDKDEKKEANQSNMNLKKHISQQIEYIKVPQVIRNFIYLLKNCSEDFQLNRYEIVNRLKLLLNNLDKNKLSKAQALQIMNDILNEDIVFGKKKILGEYSKNAIYSYWIEIIKSPVLYSHIFPTNLLSIRSITQTNLSEDSPQINSCFLNIERLFEEVMKTIFDNSIYPSVQQKSIELITFLIDQMFPEGTEQSEASNIFGTSTAAKKIHQQKLRILKKVLHCVSLKFRSIRDTFQEIDEYVTSKLGHQATKADLPEPLKLDHMQLGLLNISIAETQDWDQNVVNFIEKYEQEIDSSLLTVTAAQNKFLTIYEEEDELCFNSHPVRLSNYTLYMKQVKIKLLERFIILSQKITKIFLSQNVDFYSANEVSSLKAIYFNLSSKKALTTDQCSILSQILKNGLRIFQILHNYDLHSDEQTSKKGHLKNFMLIFAQIYDPVNFRDIFQPNMDEFFRNLITYAKHCADYCLQFVLIEPFCSNNNNPSQPFNKNIVELLIYNLILRLQSTSDQLDPFHEFYNYKQEYFSLLQKLIRFPFRCLSRYADDSFIRNYFRQIILFLIKKAHSSRFCLDYLHLMRTLFKNILFNSNRQAASPLFSQFFAICTKNSHTQAATHHSIFVNVNILQNLYKLFETGIPELADIVTELIIMLPLKSKHIIQFAKQGYIVKPLLHCLCLMSDYNYTLRTLKTFEIIISHSTAEEINQFLEGVKEKLINRLFQIVAESKLFNLKAQKISNDLSSLSLKLLAKLGCLSRNRQVPINMLPNYDYNMTPPNLDIVFTDLNTGSKVTASMIPSIQYAIDVFNKLLDSYYQSLVFMSMQMIQQCFGLLQETLPICLQKMNPLSERIITVFSSILSLSSKYLTISQSILSRIRDGVKIQISEHSQNVKKQLKTFGLNQYCKFFIKCLVENLHERVLITRQDHFIKQIAQEPKNFLWGLLKGMLESVVGTEAHHQTYQYIIRLLISQILMLNNPQHTKLNPYQNDYNHVLPYKNAALSALSEIIDTTPQQVLDSLYPDILQSAFIGALSVPNILNLKIMQHPKVIAKKIYKFLLKDEQAFLNLVTTEKGEQAFIQILQNLVSHSSQCHEMSAMFLKMIMDQTNLNLHQILYGNQSWDQICDPTSNLTKCQSQFDFNDLCKKEVKKYPIVYLIKSLQRVAHHVNKDNLENNDKMITTLTNAFNTFEILISIRAKHTPNIIFQVFKVLTKAKQSDEFADENVVFHQTFKKVINVAREIITINSNLYENFTKIIIEQPPQPPTNAPTVPPPPPIVPQRTLPRQLQKRDANNNQTIFSANNTQNFNINTNTFIDDDEYGLNIEDLDMDVRAWGQLIASILKFFKTILTNDTIFQISKNTLKKKIQKSDLVVARLDIIFIMFELIGRVERTVRATAYSCLKELLSREDHPKDLIQNDQKLKHILRPVLISLQLDFKKFTPSFLHMFRKILKLLTQCFNITLIQKLVDKLKQMQKTKQQEMQISNAKTSQNPPRYLNYSEITTEVKCIANFLGLFQHLAYAYHNHRYVNYTINSIIDIFKYVISISNYFAPKLGQHAIKMHIKKTLAKVLNTMSEKLSGESIFVEGISRDLDLQNFLEVLKLDETYPLRQRLTRETNYIQKALDEYSSKASNKKNYLIFLQVMYTLGKFNGNWMRSHIKLGEKLWNLLKAAIININQKIQYREEQQIGQRNQVILISKIILEYLRHNKQDLDLLFNLMTVFKLRTTFDLHFLRKFLRYQLYNHLTPLLRRKLMDSFLLKVQNHAANDTDRVLAISQNIIYYFILKELQMPESERSILINDQQFFKRFSETIKLCLSPKYLYNRVASNYRIAIQLLQLSNLTLGALKTILPESYRNIMLPIVWGLLRIQDKMIKNYAFVWTSNYIRVFDGFEQPKALGLYLTLIRGLQNLSQGDYQIGALIKKALNVLIPYWDSRPESDNKGSKPNNNWIDWSLRAVHEQNNEPSRLVRFWQIVVKNHKIFHKFKQQCFQYFRNKFETQMVNSMQWLMVANNPTSANPLVKKIASDMSFIYIQWKYYESKEKIKDVSFLKKTKILEESVNDKAAEICLNFFIKVALNNCTDRDDKEIMKRSLYLLKKTLILWPNTKKKFDGIRVIVNKLKTTANPQTQNPQMPTRFYYTLLNIINILLLYETDNKMIPQLLSIFKLLELGQAAPLRMGMNNQPQQPNNIFTMTNIYLLHLLCTIVKRLVKVALDNEMQEESSKLLQQIHQCIRDGFEYYLVASNKGRNNPTQPMRTQNTQKKIQIQVAISFLKIVFDMDPKSVETHLNYIKQVASALKKMFQKGFETSKTTNPNRVYQLPNLTEGSFKQMLEKDLQISVQLIKPQNLLIAQENYQKDNIKSYVTRRPLFVILLRILAAKFNSINHSEDQTNVLEIYLSIYEKIPDPQLKIEVINILKCLFIGQTAFKDNKIPERYSQIPKINLPAKKVFFLLFEDYGKFHDHFQGRKIKPSDQNYNINEKLYEQITTKTYFQFLCSFIYQLPQITPDLIEKIKIFILYAIRVADRIHIHRLFQIIDRSYGQDQAELYNSLMQDYGQLGCAQDYLDGDQVMLFFTNFLYWKASNNNLVISEGFGNQLSCRFDQYYEKLINSDQNSSHHLTLIRKTLKVAIQLLPSSDKLPRIIKQYLLNGSYEDVWGSILFRMLIDFNTATPEQLFFIATKIKEWGLFLKLMEERDQESCKLILDYIYRAYGDRDTIYGYRMGLVKCPSIQNALTHLQQRSYVSTLEILQNQYSKRGRTYSDNNGNNGDINDEIGNQILLNLDKNVEITVLEDIYKECYKNLNQWEHMIESKTDENDLLTKIDFLFHSGGDKNKIHKIVDELDLMQNRQFPFYYGKSILNFLQSPTAQNKQLNVCLLYSIFQWTCFPKNAKMKQNQLLVQIQCLLQLEEGEKIKQESLQSSNQQGAIVDALTKVVQSVYTQINSWRERMPHKHEDVSAWHAILGQRNIVYEYMRKRMTSLLDAVQNMPPHQANLPKLLTPYTDIEWNNLRMIRQERNFGIFNCSKPISSSQLYMDEFYLKQKQNFYDQLLHHKNQTQAFKIIQVALSRQENPQKVDLYLLKAKLFQKNNQFIEANAIYNKALDVDHSYPPLYKQWLLTSLNAYQQKQSLQWALNSIALLPQTLRYKTHKTRLLISTVFKMLYKYKNNDEVCKAFELVVNNVPVKAFLIWIPQIIRLSEGNSKINSGIQDILTKLCVHYPQVMYFTLKPFTQRQNDMETVKYVLNYMKKIFYNLMVKLDSFAQLPTDIKNLNRIPVTKIAAQSRKFTQVQIPLYQSYKGDIDPAHIPCIVQANQFIQKHTLNNKEGVLLKLLGTDGKEYSYRMERIPKNEKKDCSVEYEQLLVSQTLELANCCMDLWRQSSVRGLHVLEARKLFLTDEAFLIKSGNRSMTLLDVLSDYLQKKTSFQADYPDNDKSYLKLPKGEINKTVNKRMKEIVPETVLKEYFLSKAVTYDDFVTFRKSFSNQYSVVLALNYLMSIETYLGNFIVNLGNANISILTFKLNWNPKQLSPFSVRLSRNISNFISQVYINGGILPSFIATIQALGNPKLNFKSYLQLLYEDMGLIKTTNSPPLFDRLQTIKEDYSKVRKIIEVSQTISKMDSIPYQLKYWF